MTVVDTLKVRLELVNKTSQTLLAVSRGLETVERDMRRVETASRGVVASQNQMTTAVDNTVISARELYYALISWGAAYSAINITRSILETSDTITLATARLGLLTDNVTQLSDQIYQMSQETRNNYLEMLSVVSKMGINVGVGEGEWFANTDELVKFNELVAKTFAIGGQNTKEINAAMLQLTQALSSGRLQGDEFRSLFENSPLYIRYIGEYLGEVYGAVDEAGNSIALTNGQLKELAAQGLLTSDVMIDAMFYAADEIEAKFETVPRTFQQRFEQVRNLLIQQGKQLLETINNIVDNASFDRFLEHLSNQLTFIIGAIDAVLTALSPIITFVMEHWNVMGPLIFATAGAMAYFAITTELSTNAVLRNSIALRVNALQLRLVDSAQKAATISATLLRNAYRVLMAIAGDKWALAQLKLIAIGRRYNAITKIKTMLLKNEAFATMLLTTAIKLKTLAEGQGVVASIARWIVGKLNIATYTAEGVAASFATLAVNALNAAMFFILIPLGIALVVIWLVIKAVNALTGSSYTLAEVLFGTVGVIVAFITNLFIGLYNVIIAVANAMYGLATGDWDHFEAKAYVNYGEYWDRYGGKFKNNSLMSYDLNNQDYSTVLNDELMSGIDGILGNTGEIADNTSMSSEDIKFLRAMAENRVITRMNSMNINITNNNEMTVNNDRDLDGVVDYITNSLNEALNNGARGVHY